MDEKAFLDWIDTRLSERGWDWTQLAHASGVSIQRLTRLRIQLRDGNGGSLNLRTLDSVVRGLGCELGLSVTTEEEAES